MFCAECGQKASGGKFCSACGSKLLPPKVESKPSPSTSDEPKPEPKVAKSLSMDKEASAPDTRNWWQKKRFQIPAAVFLFFALIAALTDDETPSTSESVASGGSQSETAAVSEEIAAEPEAEPVEDTVTESAEEPAEELTESESEDSQEGASNLPTEQQDFISTFEEYLVLYNDAGTELQAANFLNERDSALCRITNQGRVEDWIGYVERVGANGDGYGVLEIEISDDLILKTWNNAFSDIGDGTLIEPSSSLFDTILPLQGGELVRFSGQFMDGSNHCLKDSRLSDYGRANDPDFIFKFRALDLVG